MESILPLIINALVGGGGGFLGNMIKKNGLSMLTNVLSGAVGGSILPQLLSMAGMLASGGGMDIGSIVSALVGGTGGSLLAGLLSGNKAGAGN